MDPALDTTRGLGDALALRRRFRDGTGVTIAPGPLQAKSLVYLKSRRLLGRSTVREGVLFLRKSRVKNQSNAQGGRRDG